MNGEKPREVLDEINKEQGSREKAPDEVNFGKEPAKKTADEFKSRKKRTTDFAKPEEIQEELKKELSEAEERQLRERFLNKFENLSKKLAEKYDCDEVPTKFALRHNLWEAVKKFGGIRKVAK